MNWKKTLFFTLLFASNAALASFFGDGHRTQGEVVFEYRNFFKDDDEQTEDVGIGLLSRLEIRYRKGDFQANLGGYGRVDYKDESRSFITFEDANLSYRFGPAKRFMVSGGYQVFNWSVMDAFFPADMVNSQNFDSSPESLEKIGEFTLEFNAEFGMGDISFYYFPYFESPYYPSSTNRLGQSIDLASSKIVDDNKVSSDRSVDQFGAKIYQYLFGADINLHYLNRIDRYFPVFSLANNPTEKPTLLDLSDNNEVRPYFYRYQQSGMTIQKGYEGFVFKFEGVHRWFSKETPKLVNPATLTSESILNDEIEFYRPLDHTDIALGLDYTYGLMNGQEINFIFEFSTLLGLDKEERVQTSVFQRDALFGLRYAFNDLNSREVLFNAIIDLERSREFILNVAYEQRLGDFWGLNTGLRWFEANPGDEEQVNLGLSGLKDDQFFYLNLTRFF